MIDLHTHTTASDGRYSPAGLTARAAAAGVTTLAVTDHDTVAGCAAAQAACAALNIRFVCGIEVTAVLDNTDVHLLGYFIALQQPTFLDFLAEQRRRRVERVRELIDRLARLGVTVNLDAVLESAASGSEKAIGRPQVARALVDAGYVKTTDAAFARWLSRGRPAFVPRVGPSPGEVIGRLHDAGGLVSLAHPGLTAVDEWIPKFVDSGLDALEVYHSRHDRGTTERYIAMAKRSNLLVTGGSDFHGDPHHGPAAPGVVSLPSQAFDELLERRRQRG